MSFSFDDKYVLTGSRDKTCKVYRIDQEKGLQVVCELACKDSVSAVRFADKLEKDEYVFVVGLDNGSILVNSFVEKESKIREIDVVSEWMAHSNVIRRIKFRAVKQAGSYQFASCGEDHSVRIISF